MPEPSARDALVAAVERLASRVYRDERDADAREVAKLADAYAEQAVAEERERSAHLEAAIHEALQAERPAAGDGSNAAIQLRAVLWNLSAALRQRATPPPGESGGAA